MHIDSARWLPAASGLGLAVVGVVFMRFLVGNGEDNAYIGLWLIGVALLLTSLPFVIAALVPWRLARRIVLTLAIGAAGLVGVVGVVVLVQSLVAIPSQGYGDRPVMRNHLIGLVALVAAIVMVLGPHVSPPPGGRR